MAGPAYNEAGTTRGGTASPGRPARGLVSSVPLHGPEPWHCQLAVHGRFHTEPSQLGEEGGGFADGLGPDGEVDHAVVLAPEALPDTARAALKAALGGGE